MTQMSGHKPAFREPRRWPRYPVDLPVRIVGLNGVLTTPMPARGSEISRAGMALRASIALKPGDLMQLQFPTASPSKVMAIVRNRAGDRMGLEFLTQLPPDDQKAEAPELPPHQSAHQNRPKATHRVCDPETLLAGLQRMQDERTQLRREIEALQVAILLLADNEAERSTATGFARPRHNA